MIAASNSPRCGASLSSSVIVSLGGSGPLSADHRGGVRTDVSATLLVVDASTLLYYTTT